MQTETIVDDPRRPLRGTSHLDSRAGLTFPFFLCPTFPPRLCFIPFSRSSSCVSRWKERTGAFFSRLSSESRPRRIPRNNNENLPWFFLRAHVPFRCFTIIVCACVTYTPLRGVHHRLHLLFLTAFSSDIYSAHKRCSQITVFFMTLLLHR